jgi:hypothetical protein
MPINHFIPKGGVVDTTDLLNKNLSNLDSSTQIPVENTSVLEDRLTEIEEDVTKIDINFNSVLPTIFYDHAENHVPNIHPRLTIFRKKNKIVLNGAIVKISNGATTGFPSSFYELMFTLPDGYKPVSTESRQTPAFVAANGLTPNRTAAIRIQSDGQVRFDGVNSSAASAQNPHNINCVRFYDFEIEIQEENDDDRVGLLETTTGLNRRVTQIESDNVVYWIETTERSLLQTVDSTNKLFDYSTVFNVGDTGTTSTLVDGTYQVYMYMIPLTGSGADVGFSTPSTAATTNPPHPIETSAYWLGKARWTLIKGTVNDGGSGGDYEVPATWFFHVNNINLPLKIHFEGNPNPDVEFAIHLLQDGTKDAGWGNDEARFRINLKKEHWS